MTDSESRSSILPPARLVLSLLGPPQVLVGGEPATGLGGAKILALLAYLAVEAGRPHRRSALATLFWPDHPPQRALHNLRQTLSRLRQTISDGAPSKDGSTSPAHLLVDAQFVQFDGESDYWLDVAAFQTLVADIEGHSHRRLEVCLPCLSRLARAAEIYRGEFLANLHPDSSSTLDEWLLLWREQLERQACAALQALASSHLALGEFERAAGYARQWLHLDPWNETAQRLLLRTLALGEGRNAALQHYQAFCQALVAELGVEPEDETQALAAQIEGGALADIQSPRPLNRLPAPATPLIGRQAELEQIAGDLAGQERRLLTLYGPGGCGKTRLALEVAAGQAPLWRDGVWFVPLVDVPSSEALVDALAVALDPSSSSGQALQAGGQPLEARQLLDFLRPRELLLVLDGFEHLAAGASLLEDMVHWAPEVRILVTSRTRLGVQGEWAIPLGGLELPAGERATVAEGESSSAIQLFVQSARRVAPGFCLTAENLPHVARICRLVEGLPLGIELAAAWVRLYRCQQIAAEIEGSLDFLHDRGIGRPQRHHSLRGTFETSHNLLSEAEQALFRKLSVFRGGFEVEAARQIAGADPRGLDSLLDKSLLQVSPAWRLDLHLTLREYAAEKSAENLQEEAATRERHSRFYLAFLREKEKALAGERSRETLDQIQGEIANVRAAWRRAVAEDRVEEVGLSLDALAQFYSHKGLLREAGAVFGEAAERVAALAGPGSGAECLACRLRVEQAGFLRRRADYAQAIEAAQAATTLARSAGAVLCEARAAQVWGEALWRQGRYEAARSQLERALTLVRGLPDGQQVEADSLNSLAGVCWRQGDHAGARKYLEDCLHLASHAARTRNRSIVLGNLGVVAVEQADYAAARRFYRQALDIEREIGEREGESVSLANLGNLSLYLGAYAEAESYYRQALSIHRETNARHYEAWTLGNLGLLVHYRGEQETALQHIRQALQMAKEIGDQATQATMWMEVGHALAGLGRLDEAADAYQQSVGLRRELAQGNLTTEPLAGLARVCLAQGELVQAQAHVDEILAHLESGGTLDGAISPFQVYLTCYRVLEANQDGRALVFLATAHDLLLERAARITDEKMRHSFLENVAAHRELIQTFERMRGME